MSKRQHTKEIRLPPARNLLVFLLFVLFASCGQYDYSTPLPGVLEVRLGVVNNRQSLIPFGSLNQFGLILRSLEARQPGEIKLPIFADLHAIRRNPDGDYFNCLDTLGRDSGLVLGQAYAPPSTYFALEFTISPDPILFAYYGFYGSVIEVVTPIGQQALQRLPRTGGQLSIPVQEGRFTRVTVTLDLDSSLVRRTETFEFRPYFYVSSVQIY